MSFSTGIAKIVSDQLTRFACLNPHQLAGQVENLDFWLAEVRHALAVIDGYGVRFVRLQSAQEQFVAAHGIGERLPSKVKRVPDRELRQARRACVDATARFLIRCRDEGLIADVAVNQALVEFAKQDSL